MSRYYQQLDRAGGLDYTLHKIPGLGTVQYRGPAIDLAKPYLAFVGAAQTFGRFVDEPYPSLLGGRLDLPVLNLGVGGAGPRHFNNARYLAILNQAEAVVVQVLSGRSSSNSMFDNAESGGLLGRTGSGELVRANEVFARAAKTGGRGAVKRLVSETRADYVEQFLALLEKITAPRILFWFSTRTPEYVDNYDQPPGAVLGRFPQLVNQRMVSELAAACEARVECVSSAGLPQALWSADESVDGAVCVDGRLENHYYPSPQMHRQAADMLEASCRRYTGRLASPSDDPIRRFVIVGSERTGSTLLVSLLNQHAGCLCLGELFNPGGAAYGRLPGLNIPDPERERLAQLRASDPIGFWRELVELDPCRGQKAVGFKLFYSHALAQPELMQALAADRNVSIIHITRRNLLRRLVSERQANALKQWEVKVTEKPPPRPAVTITLENFWRSATTIHDRQAMFDAHFQNHPLLHIVYEDLAERPEAVGDRAAAFLGASERGQPAFIRYQKTGADDLSSVVLGFDDLRARAKRWATFFDT